MGWLPPCEKLFDAIWETDLYSKTRNKFYQELHTLFRGAIAWNTLTNKETRAKTLKEFKRCLVKCDTDKMHFEPILATTKNRNIGYEYFWQF